MPSRRCCSPTASVPSTLEPATMGTGTIWTETDVADGALVSARRADAGGHRDRERPGRPAADLVARRRPEQPRRARLPPARLRPSPSTAICPRRARRSPTRSHIDAPPRPRRRSACSSSTTTATIAGASGGCRCAAARPASSPTRSSPAPAAWSGAPRTQPSPGAQPRLDARRSQPAGVVRLRGAATRSPTGDASMPASGRGSSSARAHVRTPRLQGGRAAADRRGDRARSGGRPLATRLPARTHGRPADDWFFEGHFKNDPCMPGTLMFEAAPAGACRSTWPPLGLHARARRLALRARRGLRRARCAAAARSRRRRARPTRCSSRAAGRTDADAVADLLCHGRRPEGLPLRAYRWRWCPTGR